MREYVEIATSHIDDPALALEVRRELQSHLEEAMSDAMAQSLDAESAELIAVGRMGSPNEVAVQLAVAHHRHLPWRIYLSPIALLGVLITPEKFDEWVNLFMWAMLFLTLLPHRTALKRVARLIYIDLLAKFQRLKGQSVRPTLISGGTGGLVAGLAFSFIPEVSRLVYSSVWYEQYVPPAFWSLLGRISWLVLLYPLFMGALAVLLARRFTKGDWLWTGMFAGLAFPVGSLPGLWLWTGPGPVVWFYFTLVYVLVAVMVGWIVRFVRERGLSLGR